MLDMFDEDNLLYCPKCKNNYFVEVSEKSFRKDKRNKLVPVTTYKYLECSKCHYRIELKGED